MAGLDAQHRGHPFAEARIRRRHHDRLGDRRQGQQYFLDGQRADVLPATNDDVGLAVGEREVAVVVHDPDVAGVVPPVVVEGPFGQSRVGVAEEQIRSATEDFAVVGQPDLDARPRVAVGEEPLVFRRSPM